MRSTLGGGKTRMLEEIIVALSAKGRPTRRIIATSATSSVPFGAVAHLLPAGARDSADPLVLIAALRDVLAPEQSARNVLVIDDAPLLDVATAGVIATLAGAGNVDVVASARSDESLPGPLVDVLFGHRAYSVELAPMSDDDIDTLLHLALGGPVDGAALMSLRDRSGGNPLFLRELTRSAVDAGALAMVGGVWRLRGDLPTSGRLREVVESRLDIVAPLTRPALELLALCDVIDLDELESLVGLEALADLESRGLLRIVQRRARQFATLGHPLHGEAIRLALPAVRSRLLMRGHVAWVEAHTALGDRDALQDAIWRLDAGLAADPVSLLHGARLAAVLQDSHSVLRLARPLFDQDPTAEAASLLADAHFQLGEWADAYATIERALQMPATSALRVDLAVTRATILLWGQGATDLALSTLDDLRHDPSMTSDDLDRLTAEHASVLVNAGQVGRARRELQHAAHSERLHLRLGAAVAYCSSTAMGGQTAEALSTIDAAIVDRPDQPLIGVADADAFLVAKAFALIEAGRLAEALAVAEAGYEAAVTADRPLTQFWFSLTIGRVHLVSGAVATSLRHFTSARALGLDAGLPGPTRSALVGVAINHALLQNGAKALSTLAEIDALPPFGFMQVERALADGWAAVANGDLAGARRNLLDGVQPALDAGQLTSAIWILHDAARLGAGAEVADQISTLAAETDTELAHTRAAHVRAMVSRNAAELGAAADRFEAMGANLLAAEAVIAAADAARGAGDQRTAAAFNVRAERLVALCENATTPDLVSAPVAVDPLTDREREIAFLAANGLTSKQIAEQLFLSYRTVNNHLQHIYDKLGTRGRADLRSALGLGAE